MVHDGLGACTWLSLCPGTASDRIPTRTRRGGDLRDTIGMPPLPEKRGEKRMKRLPVVMVLGTALVWAAGASAGTLLGRQTISLNPSPFVNCSNQGFAGNYANAEVEPWVAVNPLNSAITAAWQQDRWGDPFEGGAHGIVAWSSATNENS